MLQLQKLKDSLQIYGFLNSLFAIAAGIIGYKYAVSQNPEDISLFVKCLSITSILQIIFISILSKNKNEFIESSFNINDYRYKNNFVMFISIIISIVFFTKFSSNIYDKNNILFLFLFLSTLKILFDSTSYIKSSRDFIFNIDRYWNIRIIGTIARLISIFLFVFIFKLNYLGIIIADVIGSFTITSLYKTLPFLNIKFTISSIKKENLLTLISFDGIIRSFQQQYENLFINLTPIIINFIFPNNFLKINSAYLATGYLKALTTSLRSSLSKIEIKVFKDRYKIRDFILLYFLLMIIFLISDYKLNFSDLLLPDIEPKIKNEIFLLIFSYSCILPLTVGFSCIDYLPKKVLIKSIFILIFSYFLLISTFIPFVNLFQSYGFIFIFYPIPLSIIIPLKLFINVKYSTKN